MSLVAIVYCNCFQDGKALPPPFNHRLLVIREDGRLEIQSRLVQVDQSLKAKKYAWEKNCCAHPWRHFLNEWIGDWRAIKVLRGALNQLGAEKFPVLLNILPLVNSGTVSSADCVKALHELELFEHYIQSGLFKFSSLVALDNDKTLCVSPYHEERCIYFVEGYSYWLKGATFRIIVGDRTGDRIVPEFESECFEQVLIQSRGGTLETHFIDKVSSKRYVMKGDTRLQDVYNQEKPILALKVVSRPCTVGDFEYIVLPLKKAFNTSVALGNPVIWG